MELDLRQAITARVHGKNAAELQEVIQGSIGTDERTLPGLGVLFEMIWQASNPAERQQMLQHLESSLQAAPAPASAPPS